MSNFAEACRLSFMEWDATLPNVEELPVPQYSKKHIKRMERLFDQMRDNTYHRFTSKTVRVMIIAAVIAALVLSAFVIPSSREYILKNFDVFGIYQMTEHNNNAVSGEIVVDYIPEGYELVKEDRFSRNIVYFYEHENGKSFFISKHSSSMEVAFNTETGYIEEVTIGKITYSYNTNASGVNSVIWSKNDYIYQIEGSLSKTEFFEIAKNVK